MTTANLLVEVPLRPLKGIVKVRADQTLVDSWVNESTCKALVVEWKTRSAGYGLLRFSECDDGHVSCENEGRNKVFVRNSLLKALEGWSHVRGPELLRKHGGVDGLIAAAKPRQPW